MHWSLLALDQLSKTHKERHDSFRSLGDGATPTLIGSCDCKFIIQYTTWEFGSGTKQIQHEKACALNLHLHHTHTEKYDS